ncbi:WD40-repeat-containing domain protein [Mycena crocata]|nr:WD40-repeat-containing domain protein [Mycena crocata]
MQKISSSLQSSMSLHELRTRRRCVAPPSKFQFDFVVFLRSPLRVAVFKHPANLNSIFRVPAIVVTCLRRGVQYINRPQPPDLNCDEAAEIAAAAISPILLRRWSESVNLPLRTAIAKLITLALTGQEFLGELAQYRSRVFSHDGTSLLYLPTSNNLAVVDVATMTERFRSSGHGGTIMWAETSPNDKVIATSSFDKTVRIWSMNSGETLHVLRGATGQSWGGAFSPNGEFVAAGAGDGMVRIWRVDTGELIHTLGGFQRWVRSVAFSPDNLSLAAGGAAGILRVFNVKSGDCEQNWQLDLGGHSASALFLEIRLVQYTPRGDLFFTSPEGRIYGYRASHNLKWEHLGRSYGTMAASTDGSKLLTTVGSSVDIWNID